MALKVVSSLGGGGGSGTVNSGTAGQLTWYSATGTAVSGNANATISSGALTLGVVSGAVGGSVILAGSSSGSFTLGASAVAGTGYGFNHAGGLFGTSTYYVSLIATSGATDTSVVITPKGAGAIIAGPAPDGGMTGGNGRGIYSVDFQITRTSATQVVSGQYSAGFGANNTVSGNYSFAAGAGNTISASNCVVFGTACTASGGESFAAGYSSTASSNSFAFGALASATGFRSVAMGDTVTSNGTASISLGLSAHAQGRYGAFSNASGGFSAAGSAQNVVTMLRVATSATSATTLTANGAAAGTSNILNLVNNSAMRLTIDMVGRDTTTGDTGVWKIEAGIKRGANAAATALVGTPTVTVVGLDTNWALQTAPVLAADTTNGGLNLSITPITANSCRWVARVFAVEVV